MSDFESDTFERCPHDAENPYAQISRSLIRDETISPECRWMLIYLLSNSDGWIIKVKQIINHLKGFANCGRDRIYEIIGEAIESGYMLRVEYLKNNLKRYKYRVSETPKFKKCFRCPGSQDTGSQFTGSQYSLKKDLSSSYEDKDNHIQEREKAMHTLPIVYKSHKKVKIKEEKYNDLVTDFGEEKIKEMMERLDEYGDMKPKKFKEYGCHGAVIRRWLKDEQKKVVDDGVKIDEQEHRKIADQIVQKFPNEVKKNHIQAQNVGLLFVYGKEYELIEFRDIEFRDKVAYRLTKMNLDMERL